MVHLYGVVHGGSKTYNGRFAGNLNILPSHELLAELKNLPKNTRIGIEDLPPPFQDSIDIDGEAVPFLPHSMPYWRELESECRHYGLDIIFIDDLATMREYASKMKKANDLANNVSRETELMLLRAEMHPDQEFSESNEELIHRMQQNFYRLSTEALYVHAIERERRIAEAIARSGCHSALVGMAHGDYFSASPRALGVPIDSYSKDDIPDFKIVLFEDQSVRARFIKNATPNQDILAERESMIRRNNAVTRGRIFPERTPEFIGTWDCDVPARGLFEVYVQKKAEQYTSGTIEDCFGSARFTGVLDKDGVKFRKTYDGKAQCLGAFPIPIFYEGFPDCSRYTGEYCSKAVSGSFWMIPFADFNPNEILAPEM